MIKNIFFSQKTKTTVSTHTQSIFFMVCYKIVCTCMTQVSYKLSHGLFLQLLVYE